MKHLTIVIGLLLLFGSWNYERKFPDFSYKTVGGKTITNNYFNDTTTIVIHFHIGCGPSMFLLKDLQLLEKEKPLDFKILLILENSNSQILEFNSDEENILSEIRREYGIQKVTYDIVGECELEKYVEINGQLALASGCRKIAKKLRINYSPAIFKVNSKGRIIGKFGAYSMKSNPAGLEELLKNL